MKRPEYQWFTSDFRARRVSIEDVETLHRHVDLDLVSFELKDQILSNMHSEKRVEFFILESKVGFSEIRAKNSWIYFSPSLQVISQELSQYCVLDEGMSLLKEILIATLSWLIARGYDQPKLKDGSGASLTDLIKWSSTSSLSSIEQLNQMLKDIQDQRSVKPKTSIQSIVSLAPSNLEILIELGASDRLLACEDSSDWPETLRPLIRLGPDLNPNLDKVFELQPDLVLSSLSVPGMERIVTQLSILGLDQHVLAPRSVDDVMNEIQAVAELLDIGPAGLKVVNDLDKQRQELLMMKDTHPIPVYLEWWPKPMFTPGKACFSNELIELAGGVNIFKNHEGSSIQITPKDLSALAPRACFISWCGVPLHKLNPENLRSREGLEQLNPSAKKHVIPIDEAYTGRPGPYMLEASRQMSEVIQMIKKEQS